MNRRKKTTSVKTAHLHRVNLVILLATIVTVKMYKHNEDSTNLGKIFKNHGLPKMITKNSEPDFGLIWIEDELKEDWIKEIGAELEAKKYLSLSDGLKKDGVVGWALIFDSIEAAEKANEKPLARKVKGKLQTQHIPLILRTEEIDKSSYENSEEGTSKPKSLLGAWLKSKLFELNTDLFKKIENIIDIKVRDWNLRENRCKVEIEVHLDLWKKLKSRRIMNLRMPNGSKPPRIYHKMKIPLCEKCHDYTHFTAFCPHSDICKCGNVLKCEYKSAIPKCKYWCPNCVKHIKNLGLDPDTLGDDVTMELNHNPKNYRSCRILRAWMNEQEKMSHYTTKIYLPWVILSETIKKKLEEAKSC